MSQIVTLRRIVLSNFRAIQHLDFTFDDIINEIHGTNATGKSTILNAHMWLWSGYDSSRMNNYEIKPRDAEGKTFDRCVCSVEEFLIVGDYELRIKRELTEKWGPKNDEDLTEVFKEDQLFYYIDGQKTKTKSLFTDKLASIIDPDSFNYMSNPDYFLMLEQASQRKAILDLVGGDISDSELVKRKPEYEKLIGILKNKTIEVYQKEIKGNISEGDKQKKNIPVLITEKENEIAKLPSDKGFNEIADQVIVKKTELAEIDAAIANAGDTPESIRFQEKKKEITNMESALSVVVSAFNTEKNKKQEIIENQKIPLNGTLTRNKLKVAELSKSNIEYETQIEMLTKEKADLKKSWFTENEKKYVKPVVEGGELPKCSECGKPYTQNDLDEMDASEATKFNTRKVAKLAEINQSGKSKSEKIKELEAKIATNSSEIINLEEASKVTQEKLDELKPDESKAEDSEKYKELAAEIVSKKEALGEEPKVDDVSLTEKKDAIQLEIDELNKKLGEKTTLDKNRARIEELKQEEKDVNKSLVSWLKAAAITDAYQRDRSTILEEKVNTKFSLIKFQLFDYTNEGKQLLVCIPTVPSKKSRVPYKVANTALQVAAQVDVANTFSKKTGVILPLFLDGRESVIEIPATESQVINLVVDERIPAVTLKHTEQFDKYIQEWDKKQKKS